MQKADLKIVSARAQIRGQLMVHERYKLTPQGQLAIELTRGMALAAIPDGETSSGGMRHRLLLPSETVEWVTAVAELVYAAIESKGWVLDVPSFEEIDKFDGDDSAPGFLTKAKEGRSE